MSGTSAVPTPAPRPADRPRWELPILGALAVLSFVCVLINISSVPGGLPAHPLFVHVPVILIPTASVGALVLMARPRWLAGLGGPWIGLAAVVALGALDLTMNAGSALRAQLGLNGPSAGPIGAIINTHATLAGQLRVIFIAFTAIYLIALAVHATAPAGAVAATGPSSGLPFADRIFARIRELPGAMIGLRVLTAVLALLCLVWVYRVGDEGAKAVWYFRLHPQGAGP